MPRRIKLLPSQAAPTEPFAALVSAGAHGVIIGAIVLGSAVGTVAWEAFGELPEGLRFLLPPVTSPAPSRASVGYASQVGDRGAMSQPRERAAQRLQRRPQVKQALVVVGGDLQHVVEEERLVRG